MRTNTSFVNNHIQQLQPANITAKSNRFYRNPVNLQQFRKITRKLAGFAESLLYTLEVDILQKIRCVAAARKRSIGKQSAGVPRKRQQQLYTRTRIHSVPMYRRVCNSQHFKFKSTEEKIVAVVDSASSDSYINESIAKKL